MSKPPTTSPIHSMIDAVATCVHCHKVSWDCQCYTKCKCGSLYLKGGKCRNKAHPPTKAASRAALEILGKETVADVRDWAARIIDDHMSNPQRK